MRIQGDYLELDDTLIKHKKISGHAFVDLAGFNPYQKYKGDVVLQLMGLIKPEVDPKWLKRGDFAEQIVQSIYIRDGYKIKVYDKKEVNYDNFPNYNLFGGLLDIEIPEQKVIIEVKSKSLKDYDKIVQNPPKHEVYQGLFYTCLAGYSKTILEWIFFDPETEQQVFSGQKPTTLKNLKRFTKEYKVDKDFADEIYENYMRPASEYYQQCYFYKHIPLKDISQEALSKLGLSLL